MKCFPVLIVSCLAFASCSTSTEPSTDWPVNPNPFYRAQGFTRMFDSVGAFDAAIFVVRAETEDTLPTGVRAAFDVGEKPGEVGAVSVENTPLEWTGTKTNLNAQTYWAATRFGSPAAVELNVTGYDKDNFDVEAPVSPAFVFDSYSDSITLSADCIIRYHNTVPGSSITVATNMISSTNGTVYYSFKQQPDNGTIVIPRDSLLAHPGLTQLLLHVSRLHLDSITTPLEHRIAIMSEADADVDRVVKH